MTKDMTTRLRSTSALIGLVAGALALSACAIPGTSKPPRASRFDNAFPISVTRAPETLDLPASDDLSAADLAHIDSFVAKYAQDGDGRIVIAWPQGMADMKPVEKVAAALVAAGAPRQQIHQGAYAPTAAQSGLVVSYNRLQVRASPCPDAWSEDMAKNSSNRKAPAFGCSTQNNLAAMVANPNDLTGPLRNGDQDMSRRAVVLGKYRSGEITASTETKKTSTRTK